MIKIKIFIFLTLFIVLLTVKPGISMNTPLANPGIYVNEVTNWTAQSLDPATYNLPQGDGIVQLVYEGLLKYDNNSLTQLSDSLAYNNYSVSPDGLNYTFWLKPNIKFSLQSGEKNGQPFNAYVMQYSLDRAILMNTYNSTAGLTIDQFISGANIVSLSSNMSLSKAKTFLNLQSIHAISEYVLQITIGQPSLNFIQVLQNSVAYAISPKAIIDNEPVSYSTNLNNSDFGMVPLNYFFPNLSNNSILENLGLPGSYSLMNSGVVPNSPVDSQNEYSWTNTHSAGTGPWIVSSNEAGKGAKIIKNDNWWNVASEPKNNAISTVIWKQVNDVNTRISDLEKGTTDYADIPASNVKQLINTTTLQPIIPGIQVDKILSFQNKIIGFNMAPNISDGMVVENSTSNYSYGMMNYKNLVQYSWNMSNGTRNMASPTNPFTSLLFRKAFSYAFDYNSYIINDLNGLAIRMQGVIPLGLMDAQTNLITKNFIPSYNLSIAKHLFETVGFKGTITLFYSNNTKDSNLESIQLLKNAIESLNVGIYINIKHTSWEQYLTGVLNGSWPLWQLSYLPNNPTINDFVQAYYGNATMGGFFSTIENYNNPYVTDLIIQIGKATTITDRTAIYDKIEQNATQDFPYIYLDQPLTLLFTRDWIHGLDNPSTNSLNPKLAYPSYQYLTKYDSASLRIIELNSMSGVGLSIGLIVSISIVGLEVILYQKKRLRLRSNHNLNNEKLISSLSNSYSDNSVNKLPLWIALVSPIITLIVTVYYSNKHKNLTYFDLQKNPLRTKILLILEKEHFTHFNNLKSLLNCSVGSLKWHIQVLQEFDLINWSRIGQYKVIYLTENVPSLQEVNLYYSTSNENMIFILREFLKNNHQSINDLVTSVFIRKDYIKYHLNKLLKIEILKELENSIFYLPRENETMVKFVIKKKEKEKNKSF